MNRLIAACAVCVLAAWPGFASLWAAEVPTLELIMSDPDWIGNAPENPWWADDGRSLYYEQKHVGEDFRDLYRMDLADGAVAPVDRAAAPINSGRDRVYNHDRSLAAWVDDGDVWLKWLESGTVVPVTRTVADETAPLFSADGSRLFFERDGQFYAYVLAGGTTMQVSDIRLQKDPDAEPGFDALRAQQLRTYQTVVEDQRRSEAVEDAEQEARSDRPAPIYLGDGYSVISRLLSPAGNQVVLVVRDATADTGRAGSMPKYVTEDGYVSLREVRTRVNRKSEAPQQVLLVSLEDGSYQAVDFSELPGIDEDPLAKLREQAIRWHVEAGADEEEVKKTLEAPKPRPLVVQQALWNRAGTQLALQLLAADFKDRWLVTVAAGDRQWALQHRLTDPAWINWDHNDFGWLRDDRTLWFLSEESGYSHLYSKGLDQKRARALTEGQFVVSEPAIAPDDRYAYLVANPEQPGNYHVYRVPLAGGELEQVSDLDGRCSFVLSPDGINLLLSRSTMDRHADLYVGAADGSGDWRQLTNTVSERFAAIDWVLPEIVQVPSSHVDRPIWSKLYLPRNFDPGRSYPAVMFVHGAGYLQNTHLGWPAYFREFMFHTILANAGYVVLDMDYRASKGYGRDWRTAIYRNMGHPELEDYLDGIEFLAANYGVDRARIGIYGGSYGGFMTFMALFRAPGVFAAGAALRPVVDWMHYNDSYTGRILNTPEIDPEAYQRSSPINFAAGLEDPLLIASGMQDDNVFFQDSVQLVQRLIELHKQDFEIAIYPLDAHSFTHPDSWLDEYRRVFRLMEENLD